MIGGFQAMVGFLQVFGYEDPSSPIGWSISPTVQSIIGSFMLLGGFLGGMLCGPLGSLFSRRYALVVSAGGCIVANIIMMATENYGALYFSRIMIGMTISFVLTQGCGTPVFQHLHSSTSPKLPQHNSEVSCLDLSPGGNHLAS
jgi:MFS family permease